MASRQRRYDREGSNSTTQSFADYDTDEIRRRWRLSTPPRARSLTREEAREIIDRQQHDDSYTGYTYGDSISYKSDGNVEYLHPYLSGRKYVDFGTGGDIVNYRPVNTRQPRRKTAFYTNALEWAKLNGVNSLIAVVKWLFRAFLFILQLLAAVGMFVGSLVNLGYQKSIGFFNGLSTKPSIMSPALASPNKRTRSPRRRMHVSFSSPVEEPLSFRQTSTPLSATPAAQLKTSTKSASPNYFKPLHVYVWSITHRIWEVITTIVHEMRENSSSVFNRIWQTSKTISYQSLELLITVFTYISQHVSNAYASISDKFSSLYHHNEPQTPKRRGRPPKTPHSQHSIISPLKAQVDNGTSWAMNKLEAVAETLAYLSWAAVNGVKNGATYIQNNYASAQKSRNWLPLLLLLLLLLSFGFYGYHNKHHNNRNLTTALYQDSLVLRQWTSEAFDSLPSPLKFFNYVANQLKQLVSNIGAFFVDFYQTIRRGLINFFNLLPTPSKLFGVAAEQVKSFFSLIGNFFYNAFSYIGNFLYNTFSNIGNFLYNTSSYIGSFFANIFESIRQGFWNAYSYLPSPSKALNNAAEQTKRFFSTASSFIANIVLDYINFFGNVFTTCANFFINLFRSTWQWISNIFSHVPSVGNVFNAVSERVQWIGSSIVDFFFNIHDAIRRGFWNAYSYLPSPSKFTGKAVEQAKQLFASIGAFFNNVLESIGSFFASVIGSTRRGFWNAYSYLPSPWKTYEVVSKPVYQFFSYVSVIIIDVLNSLSSWAYKPPVAVEPTIPNELKVPEKIVERVVIHEKTTGIDAAEVEKLINERLAKYDADKTGQPDYALESSGGSIVGIGCTEVYEEKSRLQSLFGIPLYFSNYGPRNVIQRRANSPTAGECWPYHGGHGELFIKLSHKINVTSVSYEHLSPRLSPEGHMKTAPKEFRVFSIQNYKESNERKHLLGDFIYADNGESLQTFVTQFPDDHATEVIGLETFTNHGSPVTCLYRFRVHGEPVIERN